MIAICQQIIAVLVAYCAISCSAKEEGIKVFKATISPIPGSNSNVSGEVVVFVPPEDKFFGDVGYGGYLSNLRPDLGADDCLAKNGCGVHIHSGISCENKATQGGHYFLYTEPSDPWLDEKYTSDSSGKAVFSSIVSIRTNIINDLPLVVHDENGSRIGCGMLKEIDPYELYSTNMQPVFTSGVHGQVLMYQKMIDLTTSQIYPTCYYGIGSGLEPDIDCESDEVPDACETHVHAGNSCESLRDQGEAFFNSLVVNEDPWKHIRFLHTDSGGNAQFMHCIHTGEQDYDERVFILHDKDGSRAACGQLLKLRNRVEPKKTYIAWILLVFLIPGIVLPFYARHENNSCFSCRSRDKK